jgi:transketolase
MSIPNKNFRRKIVEMVYRGGDGHIPSAYSILEIVTVLYREFLKVDPRNPAWTDRDIFVLSKGHGCLALYVNLHHLGFISDRDLEEFCTSGGILGEHPDRTKVPGAEASTGSLGHGFSFAVGTALGYKIARAANRVIVLLGDGECQEGTVWEAANVARNRQLNNLCAIVDLNESAAQLLPFDLMREKWSAFGFNVVEIDGHSEEQILNSLNDVPFGIGDAPTVILARTIKGFGVPMLEGHGIWHHKIPNSVEFAEIMEALR